MGAAWGVPRLHKPQWQLRGASPAHLPPYLKDVLVIFRVQHSRDGRQGNARFNLHGHQRICELEANGCQLGSPTCVGGGAAAAPSQVRTGRPH